MADVTANYALPYQELGDSPDGATGLQDLAEAVDAVLLRMDTTMKVTLFPASGTWTKNVSPAPRWVEVIVVGSGGGGGGVDGTGVGQGEGAYGGGGGWAIKKYVASSLAATETVTVGAAGTGGAAGANDGGTGGTVSFSSAGNLVQATGGAGGGGMTAAATGTAQGGLGGVGSGGDINLHGQPGCGSRVIASLAVLTAVGGMSGGGMGAGARALGAQANGNAGQLYGGGGGGAFVGSVTTNFAGGAGGKGCVIVREYF